MNYNVEIGCYSVQDVIHAKKGGATRVELCADSFVGGTTPSHGYVKWAVEHGNMKVSMMIRPRGGDFVYSEGELEIMSDDIEMAAGVGADCVVLGCMTQDGFLDYDATSRLVEIALKHNLEVTFHRAFDLMREPEEALEQLKKMSVTRVLTSGQGVDVIAGGDFIASLVKQAGDDIIIMAGGGLNENNIDTMLECGVREVHSPAKTKLRTKAKWLDNGVKMGSAECDDSIIYVTDVSKVKIITNKVKNFFMG